MSDYFHVYNRGVDKRKIFANKKDFERFKLGISQFNTSEVLGSLNRERKLSKKTRLVNFVAYAINPNHFHFILEPIAENGVRRFMHKFTMGYSKYFNTKYRRSGALFQGKYKSIHIDSNEYLLYLSAYINLNHLVHSEKREGFSMAETSWGEYMGLVKKPLCDSSVVLLQFKNSKKYKEFAEDCLKSIKDRKLLLGELEKFNVEQILS